MLPFKKILNGGSCYEQDKSYWDQENEISLLKNILAESKQANKDSVVFNAYLVLNEKELFVL